MQFGITFNPDNINKYSTMPDRCIAGTAPTLHVAECAYGTDIMKAWLALQLEYINVHAGVKTQMTSESIMLFAESILHNKDFAMLKVTDIMLFINQFCCGKYGRFYGEVDPMKIGEMLYEYKEWKATQLARMQRENSPLLYR